MQAWPAILLATALAALLAIASHSYLARARTARGSSTAARALAGPRTPPSQRTAAASRALAAALPARVSFRGDAPFAASLRGFWAAQAQARVPECVVRPACAADVARAVRVLAAEAARPGALRFGVRSAGHSPVGGAAGTLAGINIDLGALRGVQVAPDRRHVTMGPAARWGDVYRVLEPLGLGVAGGRAASVGVGGLVLGGGLSFFSARRGLVCEGVVAFEVVLADGAVVAASETARSDLWRALKGGGNNFGIVTALTARTFPLGRLWAGYNFHTAASAGPHLDAFHRFCRPEGFDADASMILALGFDSWWGAVAVATNMQYAKPVKDPPVFRPFRAIRGRLWSTMGLKTLGAVTAEMDSYSPPGFRQLFHTTTFENDLDLLRFSHELFRASVEAIRGVKGITWSLVFQPLTPAATSIGRSNVMGIETDKTLVVVLVSTSWKLAEDDETVYRVAHRLIDGVEARAREMGLFNRYKYANYCSSAQDPMAGYGGENLTFLRDTSRKYDPYGLFQKSCVGGFKLFQ